MACLVTRPSSSSLVAVPVVRLIGLIAICGTKYEEANKREIKVCSSDDYLFGLLPIRVHDVKINRLRVRGLSAYIMGSSRWQSIHVAACPGVPYNTRSPCTRLGQRLDQSSGNNDDPFIRSFQRDLVWSYPIRYCKFFLDIQ